jgi:signal transduction histidine kinase
MSNPETSPRRDEPQNTKKNAVRLENQTRIPATSELNRSDINDSELDLGAKAAMIENSIAAVLAYDNDDRLIYSNQAGLRLCGVDDLAELQGAEFPQVRTPGDASATPLPAYLSRITYSEELFLEVKPAKLLPCHVSANHLHDANGASILSYANILDFTGMNAYRARLEVKNRELIAANNKAEIANRAKSEFLANMSHELRTPLNAVIGFSELIHNESFGPCERRYRDYALNINESGQHLLDLINDILDISKVESGANEIHEEKIEIREVTDSVVTMVKDRAQKGGVELCLEVPDNPPALLADSRKMKQILVNLLSNAIKFTDPGGKVTFKIWCREGSGYVFQIMDTGIGIALDDIPKALAPFQQVHSALDRKYEGTGLGLPLTKSLVEQHGGSLDLQSRFGIGTTVTVRLPEGRVVSVA